MKHRARAVRHASVRCACVAAITALAGCATAGAQEAASLTRVSYVEEGALTVCTDLPFAPFAFVRDGEPTGFDVEVVQEVADDLGVDLDLRDTSFDDIVTADPLNDGECDVAVSAVTITGARARILDFSSPYFDAHQTLVTPRGSRVTRLEDLAGRRIGVQTGSSGEAYLYDYAPARADVVAFETSSGVQSLLRSGNLDAAVLDNSVAAGFVSANRAFKLTEDFDTVEQYGMAVRKDGNIALLRAINDTLAAMREDGRYEQIHAAYFD